jgi:hypothetical protein
LSTFAPRAAKEPQASRATEKAGHATSQTAKLPAAARPVEQTQGRDPVQFTRPSWGGAIPRHDVIDAASAALRLGPSEDVFVRSVRRFYSRCLRRDLLRRKETGLKFGAGGTGSQIAIVPLTGFSWIPAG